MSEVERAGDVKRAWRNQLGAQLRAAGFGGGREGRFTRPREGALDAVLIVLHAAGRGESAVDLDVVWLSTTVTRVSEVMAELPEVTPTHQDTWAVTLESLVASDDREGRDVASGFFCDAVAEVEGCTRRVLDVLLRYGEPWWTQVTGLDELRTQMIADYPRRGLGVLERLVAVSHLTGDRETLVRALDDHHATLEELRRHPSYTPEIAWEQTARERFLAS